MAQWARMMPLRCIFSFSFSCSERPLCVGGTPQNEQNSGYCYSRPTASSYCLFSHSSNIQASSDVQPTCHFSTNHLLTLCVLKVGFPSLLFLAQFLNSLSQQQPPHDPPIHPPSPIPRYISAHFLPVNLSKYTFRHPLHFSW